MLRCTNSIRRKKVLKSSPHALLRSGAWMTVQNMYCMVTHLWTRRHHNDRCTRQNSSVNSVVFRKFHHDSTRGCWDHLHTVRSKVVRGGTEKHMEHIAINQHTQLANVLRQAIASIYRTMINALLCHDEQNCSQLHFREIMWSSQPVLLRNDARVTV